MGVSQVGNVKREFAININEVRTTGYNLKYNLKNKHTIIIIVLFFFSILLVPCFTLVFEKNK